MLTAVGLVTGGIGLLRARQVVTPMNVLVIARVNVLRLLRDRTSLFFVFVLPIVLIVVLGTAFGGRVAPRMGIVATDARRPRDRSS